MLDTPTGRIVSRIFEGFDAFEIGELTEDSLTTCIETNMSAIENPNLNLIEEKFISLIAFLDEASYIVPYSKKRASILSELKKVRKDVSELIKH